jgi:hypothetical protein
MPIGKGGLGKASMRALRRARKGSKLRRLVGDVKDLKKMVNKTIENKQQTYNSGSALYITDIPLAQRPTLNITQGTADGDNRPSAARIGNSITLMRTQLNLQVRQSTSGLTNTVFRILVVESINGKEDLTIDDVLQAGGGALVGTNQNAYTSCYTTKTDTNKRYKLHYDKVVNLSTYKGGFFSKKLTLRYGKSGRVVNYDGNLPTPTDYSLQILAVSEQTSIGVAPILTYSMRSTYKDA